MATLPCPSPSADARSCPLSPFPRPFGGILRTAGYRGYAPLETLGEGDPRDKMRRFLDEARTALA